VNSAGLHVGELKHGAEDIDILIVCLSAGCCV